MVATTQNMLELQVKPSLKMRAFIRLTPLIGGPAFLRVHTAFLCEVSPSRLIGFDFLPAEASSAATISRLLRLEAAPGIVRELQWPTTMATSDNGFFDIGDCVADVADLRQRAVALPKDLHLVTNNCWRHTLSLAEAATGRTPVDIVLSLIFRRRLDAPAPEEVDDLSLNRMLADDRARRYGSRPLVDLLGDDNREQMERSIAIFQRALEDEEKGRGDR